MATQKRQRLDDVKSWLTALVVVGSVAIAGCGGSTTAPMPSRPLGVLLGVADQCSGLPGAPPHPVQVIVYRDGEVVATQTKLGSHHFKFSLPAGKYSVTSNQSYAVPLNVELESGQVAHASVYSSCD